MIMNGTELIRSERHYDPAIAAASEAVKARIQSAYIMAIQKPRDTDEARDRILHACKRPGFAERVEFSKPVAGRSIKGPSIRFAELALREWGNIMTDVQVLYEDDAVRRTKVQVIDLETNASFSKEIQISKHVERKNAKDREIISERMNTSGEKVFIVKATEDELHNKEAAAISKALRNEGLRVIPSDIIDEALDTARRTLSDRDKKDPDAAKKAVLDSFSSIGIRPREIQRFLKHDTGSITAAELQELRGIYRAIRDGEAKWSDYLEAEAPGNGNALQGTFESTIPKGAAKKDVSAFLAALSDSNKATVEEVKAEAVQEPAKLWLIFNAWMKQKKAAAERSTLGDTAPPDLAPGECPERPGVTTFVSICDKCERREGCPVWG